MHYGDPHFTVVIYGSWAEWFESVERDCRKYGFDPAMFVPSARMIERLGEPPTAPWQNGESIDEIGDAS